MGSPKRKSRQPDPESLIPLLVPLQALQNLLSQFNDQGVIIGGVAASLLGTPRYTVDIDAVFLLRVEDLSRLLAGAADQGIKPRISDPVKFARKNRVLLLRHEASGTDIDIILGILPFEVEMVERSQSVDVGDIQLRAHSRRFNHHEGSCPQAKRHGGYSSHCSQSSQFRQRTHSFMGKAV